MGFRKKNPPEQPRSRVVQRSSPSQGRGAVFSYHANRQIRAGSAVRDIEEPKRAEDPRPKKMLRWLKRLPTLGAMLAILIVTCVLLQLSSVAKVKVIGGDNQLFLRDQKVYQEAAHKEFTPFFNSNKLTVNASGIAANLRKQFPELKAVSVTLPVIGNQPTVYIQPAIPKVILVGKGGMYLLDDNGRALITANQVPDLDGMDIPVVNDQSGITIQLGKIALPQDTVSFISQVQGQLKAKGLKITSLELPPVSSELRMRIEGAGYYVKFNLHGDAREETGVFLAVKDYLESQHKSAGEYIDARVENKAYYK